MNRLIFCCALLAGLGAAELADRAGTVHAYETITVDPSLPKTAVILRSPGKIVSLPLSSVDPARLPEPFAAQVAEFTAKQKADGLVLHEDEWVDRDGMLLKTDKRFSYAKRLVAAGDNFFEVKNVSDDRLTVGVRQESQGVLRGLEFAVLPGKSKKIRLSRGVFTVLAVERVPGGAELNVRRTEDIAIDNVHYTLTYGAEGNMKTTDLGRIAIPESMR